MTLEQNAKKLEKFFEEKQGFWWALLYEMLAMFSNKKSFFASKRFERFVMFNVFIWMIIGYVVRNWLELETLEIVELSTMLLAGSAFNTVQIRKDQTNEKAINSDTIN